MRASAGLLSLALACFLSCQDAETGRQLLDGAPVVFRAEVPKGTAGAIPCDYLEGEPNILWFGPPHEFGLQYVGGALGNRGTPVVAFEIVESQSQAFSDFTESIVNQRMAIEVDGKILSAPNVNARLPGMGIIEGGLGGFSEEEVQTLIQVLGGG